jgi:hypothetical protein
LVLYFFEDETADAVTVTSDRYVHMVNEFLLPELRRRDMDIATFWFQQDGATAHTARQSMKTLRTVFEHRIISRYGDIPWPAGSADLSAGDFFSGTTCKAKFCKHVRQTYVTSNREFLMKSLPSHRSCYSRNG